MIQSPIGRPSQGGTTLASDSDPPLRPEGLAKEGRRSLPTPTRLSDRKAWPRKERRSPPTPTRSLQPEGLVKEGTTLASDSDPLLLPEGLANEGMTLTSDSDPPLRSGVHRTSAYSSSPTGAIGANWEMTKWGRLLGRDPKNQEEQVR